MDLSTRKQPLGRLVIVRFVKSWAAQTEQLPITNEMEEFVLKDTAKPISVYWQGSSCVCMLGRKGKTSGEGSHSGQSFSHVWLFATPWTIARQGHCSFQSTFLFSKHFPIYYLTDPHSHLWITPNLDVRKLAPVWSNLSRSEKLNGQPETRAQTVCF